MGLEVATYVSDLVPTNPTTSDPLAQGDDHIRLLKASLKASFPLVNGPLNASMVPFTPVGGIAATTVAGALAELDSEKYSVGGALGTPASGNLANCTFPTLNQNTTGTAAVANTIADGAVSTAAKLAANVVGVAKLAREGTAGQVLTSGGAGANASWGDLPAGGVSSVGGNTGAVTNVQVAEAVEAAGAVTAGTLYSNFNGGGGGETINVLVQTSGTVRIYFGGSTSDGAQWDYVTLYKNGVSTGHIAGSFNSAGGSNTRDIAVVAGDTFQLICGGLVTSSFASFGTSGIGKMISFVAIPIGAR